MPPVVDYPPNVKLSRNLSGLGCIPCTTPPQTADDYYGGQPIGAPGATVAPGAGFDLNTIPDWLKYGAIAVAVYLLVKK